MRHSYVPSAKPWNLGVLIYSIFILFEISRPPSPEGRQYRDESTWRDRVNDVHENWKLLMEDLITAYLHWKYSTPSCDPSPADDPVSGTINSANPSEGVTFKIFTIDMFTLNHQTVITRAASDSNVTALGRKGFLGNSPLSPSVAISFRTLDFYRILRQCKPSFSVEGFAKVVCDMYSVSRQIYATQQLSHSYYLETIH